MMSKYSPEEAYRRIKLNEKSPLKKLYLSIPRNSSLTVEVRGKLQTLTKTELVFLDETRLITLLADILNRKKLEVEASISISRRGQYVYEALKQSVAALAGILHFSVEFTREKENQLEIPNISGSRLLVIDDIFGTGFTFDRIISALGENKDIACLFLFGPRSLINEFKALHPRVKMLFAYELSEDPREDLINFTDLDSLIELKNRYGMRSVLFRRVFNEHPEEALLLLNEIGE